MVRSETREGWGERRVVLVREKGGVREKMVEWACAKERG